MTRLFLKFLALLALGILSCFGQCVPGSLNQSNTAQNCVIQAFYDGSNNLTDLCSAPALNAVTTFYVSSGTLINVVVTTNSGVITFSSTSYLWIGATVVIGGSATTALNGTYKVTAVSGATATVTTSGVSNGTYNDATLSVSTRSPLLNALIWAIQKNTYSGTTFTGSYWAGTLSSAVPHGLACSNRANY